MRNYTSSQCTPLDHMDADLEPECLDVQASGSGSNTFAPNSTCGGIALYKGRCVVSQQGAFSDTFAGGGGARAGHTAAAQWPFSNPQAPQREKEVLRRLAEQVCSRALTSRASVRTAPLLPPQWHAGSCGLLLRDVGLPLTCSPP